MNVEVERLILRNPDVHRKISLAVYFGLFLISRRTCLQVTWFIRKNAVTYENLFSER